jgi:hypothetical protein
MNELAISKQAVCHGVCDWKACKIADSPGVIAVFSGWLPNIQTLADQIVYNSSPETDTHLAPGLLG